MVPDLLTSCIIHQAAEELTNRKRYNSLLLFVRRGFYRCVLCRSKWPARISSRRTNPADSGLVKAFKILHTFKVEHIIIVCNHSDPRLSNSITQALQAVHRSTLGPMVLSGDNINAWVHILSNTAPQLKQFAVCGTDSKPQEPSRSSALSVRHLVLVNVLKELKVENVNCGTNVIGSTLSKSWIPRHCRHLTCARWVVNSVYRSLGRWIHTRQFSNVEKIPWSRSYLLYS